MEFFIGNVSEPTTESINRVFSSSLSIIGPIAFWLYDFMFVIPWWSSMTEPVGTNRLLMFGDPTAMPISWAQDIFRGPLYLIRRGKWIPNDLFAWCWGIALRDTWSE
jgi:hypothetical protein